MNLLRYIYRTFKQKRYIKKIRQFKKCGKNFICSLSTSSFSFSTIEIGENVYIGKDAWFNAYLKIGNNVMFGPSCKIIGGDHIFGIKGKSNRFLKPSNNSNAKPITIEDEVWCGANVIILKGVVVGMGSIIGAGSVINKSTPPFTVNVGYPFRPVKKIFDDQELLEHLILLGYSNNAANEIVSRRTKMLSDNNLSYIPIHKNYADFEVGSF